MIKDGRVKVDGVTTQNRLGALPSVPTLAERGMTGFEVEAWHGTYASKGTPAPVLEKINAALRVAMLDPMVRQRLTDLSSDVQSADKITSVGLKTHLEAAIARWAPIIKKSGVSVD